MAQINIKVDDQLKKDATRIFNDMGLDLTTGIKIYLKRVQQDQKIPFEIKGKDDVDQLAQQYHDGDPSVVNKINRLLLAIAGGNTDSSASIGGKVSEVVKNKSARDKGAQGIGPSMLKNIYHDSQK